MKNRYFKIQPELLTYLSTGVLITCWEVDNFKFEKNLSRDILQKKGKNISKYYNVFNVNLIAASNDILSLKASFDFAIDR